MEGEDMKTGTTSTGFAFKFDERNADDMRMVELIAISDDETASEFQKLAASSKILEMLLGKEQKAALYDHIGKSNDGRVPVGELMNALTEIMNSGGETLKN